MARVDAGGIPVTRLDTLRERLLAPELRGARALLSADGPGALLALALELVREAKSERDRFEEFSRSVEGLAPGQRRAAIERHLRETTPEVMR